MQLELTSAAVYAATPLSGSCSAALGRGERMATLTSLQECAQPGQGDNQLPIPWPDLGVYSEGLVLDKGAVDGEASMIFSKWAIGEHVRMHPDMRREPACPPDN